MIFIGQTISGVIHEKNLNAHQGFFCPACMRLLSEGEPHREEIQPPFSSTVMETLQGGNTFKIMQYRLFRFDLLSWIHGAGALLF